MFFTTFYQMAQNLDFYVRHFHPYLWVYRTYKLYGIIRYVF